MTVFSTDRQEMQRVGIPSRIATRPQPADCLSPVRSHWNPLRFADLPPIQRGPQISGLQKSRLGFCDSLRSS